MMQWCVCVAACVEDTHTAHQLALGCVLLRLPAPQPHNLCRCQSGRGVGHTPGRHTGRSAISSGSS